MRTSQLLQDLQFHGEAPYSQPLCVDENGRVLRFMLKPGQAIREHEAALSPFYVVVLKGRGVFSGGDGREHEVGPDDLLIFEPGERHSVRALNEDLVFVGFLHGVPGTRPDRVGGDLARAQD
jgi:quercetin dioxygenase-like cupin family protein